MKTDTKHQFTWNKSKKDCKVSFPICVYTFLPGSSK